MANPLKPVIEVELLKFKEGIRHIRLSLDRGHITKDRAHSQMNKLASIYADCIARRVEGASDEQVNAVFGEPEAYDDPNGSDGIDDDPFVKYEGPDDPDIRYR